MMAVAISPDLVQPFLDTLHDQEEQLRVVVACVNSPKSVTLSGQRSQIGTLQGWFQQQHIMAKILPIPVAYHSFQMQEIAVAYRDSVGNDTGCPLVSPQSHIPQMISSVSGEWIDGDALSKSEYWVNNLLSTVQFVDAFRKLCSTHSGPPTKKLDGSHRRRLVIDTVLEIGPHAAMRGPCRDILRESGRNVQVEYLSVLMRKTCGIRTTLETMGRLRCMGYPVDLNTVNSKPSKANKQLPKVLTDLPPYQFNKTKSYWREGTISKSFRFRRFGRHELLGWPDDDWNPLLPKWNNVLHPSDPVWVRDHQVRSHSVTFQLRFDILTVFR
jgi:acyl transferase domain-containing protein